MTRKEMFKRKYKKRLIRKVIDVRENRDFLISRFKKEWERAERSWDEIERTTEKSRDREQKRQRRYQMVKEAGTVVGLTLLGMVAVCGILTIAVVAPNAVAAFGRLGIGKHHRYFDRRRFQKKLYYYREREYVEVSRSNDSDGDDNIVEIKLTSRGESWLAQRAFKTLRVLPQERWDGIWRIVIFDIPESNRGARDGVRGCLKRMGFYQLQKSTFVSPYPCHQEIEFLEKIYNIGHGLRLVETAVINYDDDLKKVFSLVS